MTRVFEVFSGPRGELDGGGGSSGDPYLLRVVEANKHPIVAGLSGHAECDSAWSPELPPSPVRRVKTETLARSNLSGDALDLVPGFVFDGDAVAPPLGLQARLGLTGDQDLLGALGQRSRLDEGEQ